MRISEQIACSLEKSILKGEFPSGSRFPSERELAERFQASRSSIREAVGRLAQLGLVETLPQSGTYVGNYLVDGSLDLLVHLMKQAETLDSDVVLSLMEFRRMAEGFAVRKAVISARADEL
ncbi:MAG: FadR family transcriptional regulator, partial [Deltaproteobacteria bacterium]|nr:FadR family transcriptional regulator [Deltaproteobacteria bacterium]